MSVHIFTRYALPPSPALSFLVYDEDGVLDPDYVSMAQQQFAADADINNIIARYLRTGSLVDPSAVLTREPSFGDATVMNDYHEAYNLISAASETFDGLPSHVRERLNNDPANMLEVLSDPELRDLAVELGFYPQANQVFDKQGAVERTDKSDVQSDLSETTAS